MTVPSSDTSSLALPPPEVLAAQIKAGLPRFGHTDWLPETRSTNADLLDRARHGAMNRPWLLGTHLQTQGRGRAGRTWQNRVGSNLMFSCAFDVFLPARQLPTLAPLIGMVSCQALRRLVGPAVRSRINMKWPNDVQWDQAKLAGILIESTRSGTAPAADHHLIIIGMGLNLQDARALSLSLDRQVADWSEISTVDATAAGVQAGQCVCHLAQTWYEALNLASAHGFSDLPAQYAEVDGLAGQILDVLDNGKLRQTGVACGIDPQGRLLLRNNDGTTPVSVGEISVRVRR